MQVLIARHGLIGQHLALQPDSIDKVTQMVEGPDQGDIPGCSLRGDRRRMENLAREAQALYGEKKYVRNDALQFVYSPPSYGMHVALSLAVRGGK